MAETPPAAVLWPSTPQMVDDAPPAAAPASAAQPVAPNPFPNTPGMIGDDGKPLAPEQPAEASRAEPDPALLEASYPIQWAEDFLPHEPSVTAFRALAAKHKLPPAAVQEIAAMYVAEMRRLAEIEDPMDQVRAQYPRTPQMRP
jgi:hypothetical protein